MFNKKAAFGIWVIAGALWAIAAVSPITSQKYWHNFRKVSGISEATFLPMSDLPFRVMRSPVFTNTRFDDQYTSSTRIDLDKFFGFELRKMVDKDLFDITLDEKKFTVRLKSVEKKGEDYFTWIGILNDNDNHLLVLTYLNGYVGASINCPAGVYAIQFDHGRHLLKKFDSPQ